MAQREQVTITCPRCQQPFQSEIVRIIESGDEQAATQLAAGSLNKLLCPNCGFEGLVSRPLLYHDRSRQVLLAAIHGLEEMNEEQVWEAVGEQLQWLVRRQPLAAQEAEYLYKPRMFPTLELLSLVVSGLRQGVDTNTAVKLAYRSQLLQALLLSGKNLRQRRALFAENTDLADEEMLGVLATMVEDALQNGRMEAAARLNELRDDLTQYLRATTGLPRLREHVLHRRPDLDPEGLGPTPSQPEHDHSHSHQH